MGINISESYDSFRQLRENNAYYVDKTAMIKQYLVDNFKSAVLFARPRRFGKTLTMTMFREFLDISQDSRDVFEGLEIMNYKEVVDKFMNKYPVVFLSLKEIYGKDEDDFKKKYLEVISDLCKQYDYLLKSEKVNAADKELLESYEYRNNKNDGSEILGLLARMLNAHFNKPVFILIDEYDVPMAKTLGTEVYEIARDLVEHMLSYVCKTNENVKAVMLSGCLYTVKNSTYTGVNNIVKYTILSPLYASSIGFNDDDVKKILADAGLSDWYDTVKEWYDGYLFGRDSMYCPWDVLSFVGSLLDDSYSEAMGPENYWVNTSETSIDIIRGFFGKVNGVTESFERLLAGETIDCTVNDNLPYHRIHDSGENIWSALLETGYLTKTVKEKMPLMPLKIPNREIKDVFRQEVWYFFKDKVENSYVTDLASQLWSKNILAAQNNLEKILESTLSFYHEYHEYSYHLILDGFFTGLGYRVLSEAESGYGRSDLIILDPARRRGMILELKHAEREKELEKSLKDASTQIIEKKYDSILKYQNYETITRYGMAFYDKKARIAEV